MDYLRLILLLLGAVAVVGIYLWSRRNTSLSSDRMSPASTRHEPSLGEEAFEALDVSDEVVDLPAVDEAVAQKDEAAPGASGQIAPPAVDPVPATRDDLIVALTLLAPINEAYSGNAIQAAAQAAELVLSAHQVYQCWGEGEHSSPLFSLANLLEPGSLDFSAEEDVAIPGLCLMLRLPGPHPGAEAFEKMLACGQGLVERLGGTLCNDRRIDLTPQYLNHLREQILVFDHQSEV